MKSEKETVQHYLQVLKKQPLLLPEEQTAIDQILRVMDEMPNRLIETWNQFVQTMKSHTQKWESEFVEAPFLLREYAGRQGCQDVYYYTLEIIWRDEAASLIEVTFIAKENPEIFVLSGDEEKEEMIFSSFKGIEQIVEEAFQSSSYQALIKEWKEKQTGSIFNLP